MWPLVGRSVGGWGIGGMVLVVLIVIMMVMVVKMTAIRVGRGGGDELYLP